MFVAFTGDGRTVSMTLQITTDRSMIVQPHQTVQVQWLDIDTCLPASRVQMTPEAVEKKWRTLLQLGNDAMPWPPLVGHWEGDTFRVDDGRHTLEAARMIGRPRVLVCWLDA